MRKSMVLKDWLKLGLSRSVMISAIVATSACVRVTASMPDDDYYEPAPRISAATRAETRQAYTGAMQRGANERATSRYYDSIKNDPPVLRRFLEQFPKGGDLHNHLAGAIYAEPILAWAVEDDYCVDGQGWGLVLPTEQSCEARGLLTAASVQSDGDQRRQFINAVSMRDFVPTSGWSAHDQFFSTFIKSGIEFNDPRFGDMLAQVQTRAGHQNELYLELMKTLNWFEIFAIVGNIPESERQTDDLGALYQSVMDAGLEEQMDALVASAVEQLDAATTRARQIMGCTEVTRVSGGIGCGVEVRYLYQSIRSFPPEMVFAGFIFGYALSEADDRVVGLNLVAPEDDHVSTRDYRLHMNMLDFLWQREGPRNISLHAGEVWLGLVPPEELLYRIGMAIEVGHAKRIGHGTAIAFEHNAEQLMTDMAENQIMVEINLTSSEYILGVSGDGHPFELYRHYGVPLALSTDDEGVARIDLTHEYQLAVERYDLTYAELKEFSRNSLTYSFLPGESIYDHGSLVPACENDTQFSDNPSESCKGLIFSSDRSYLQWQLEGRFMLFERARSLLE